MNSPKNYFQIDNIYTIPVFYSSLDFAQIVRKAFFEIVPDCIALELPSSLLEPMLMGVRRLPYLSVLTFASKEEDYKYIPIQPCDPLIEAIRLAYEHEVELYFIDKDIEQPIIDKASSPTVLGHLPLDTYYASKLGLKSFYDTYEEYLETPKDETIYMKILEIARSIRKMSKAYKKVLFIHNINHHKLISSLLSHDNDIPKQKSEIKVKEYTDIHLMHFPETSFDKILGTMPFLCYLYELERKGLSHFHIGIELKPLKTHTHKDKMLEQEFNESVFDKANWLAQLPTKDNNIDIYDYLHELMIYAARSYQKEWKDIAIDRYALALRFARNYALVDNYLVPSPYKLIIAAKNCINDDFALKLYRIMNFYPFTHNYNYLNSFEIIKDNKVSISDTPKEVKPYLPISPWILEKVPIKERPIEKQEGLWEKVWNKGSLVSYPPEDIIIENYFQYLRTKGKTLIENRLKKTVEFTSSLLDGLDIKETIRHLHLNKIFVTEQTPIRSSVGTVVIIFDNDDKDAKYTNKMTWYAENINESDLVLYSTMPGEVLVGPGISRAEYGGLLSIYPPRGIANVWEDTKFNKAKTKGDTLLLAGLHYSDKKYIIYVADIPPSKHLSSLAKHNNKHIIYIPIKELSLSMLKKVRFFHFLSSKSLRSIAKRYIR